MHWRRCTSVIGQFLLIPLSAELSHTPMTQVDCGFNRSMQRIHEIG
jgi:hypothetical protein